MKTKKMKTKNQMVSFCTIVLALFMIASVSAVADIATVDQVKIDGITIYGIDSAQVSLIAGEDITVKVYFTALENDTDVTLELELEGDKESVYASTGVFNVREGMTYKKVMTLRVPYELKDELTDTMELNIEIDGKDYKTEKTIVLEVEREDYNTEVKSVTTPSSITAGDTFPIEIVLKNIGYNDLDDVYVTAKLKKLVNSPICEGSCEFVTYEETIALQGPKWFGDLYSLDSCDDNCDKDDTVMGRLYLEVPYNTKAGSYVVEIVVENDDVKTKTVKQVIIKNDFSNSIVSTSTTKTVARNEIAEYDLLIVNPTNNVKVYRIVTDSEDVTVNQAIVAVPAGSSKTIKVTASSNVEGKQTFNVNIFSGESLEKTVSYTMSVEGKKTNTVFVLTVVLAIIFLVLLVVLIVLLGKRPEKTEEFGESYY